MRVLLLSMPDTVKFIDNVMKLPNLAIISLAGNLKGHEVKVLDLVLFNPKIREALERTLAEFRPDVVGLSAMTFQFDTLMRIARFIRLRFPSIKIVAGGYHVTLMARELTASPDPLPFDFIVRGEGEGTFQELSDELQLPVPNLSRIQGLSYHSEHDWVHNPDRELLAPEQIFLPDREARMAKGFSWFNMSMDVAETSRGCPYNCKFCSITWMYGRTFRRFPIHRILEDLARIRKQGTKAVFFTDDNITCDIDHFLSVCKAIVAAGLHDLTYMVQVTAAGIARNPGLVAEMDRANFRYVFVGFESMIPSALREMNKPTSPEINRIAADLLKKHGICIIAGCIVGYPDDTKETVAGSITLIRNLRPDMIYAQYLTPYPKTAVRQELLDAGLIVNPDDYRRYDGFTCNIRTRHMNPDELYSCLEKEVLKTIFDLRFLSSNFFLRNMPGFIAKAYFQYLLVYFGGLFKGHPARFMLDI
jgi:anaerobic magnesium-protoporphyrin IX monomethyl ester cyclase